jgi:hypothetical protein
VLLGIGRWLEAEDDEADEARWPAFRRSVLVLESLEDVCAIESLD